MAEPNNQAQEAVLETFKNNVHDKVQTHIDGNVYSHVTSYMLGIIDGVNVVNKFVIYPEFHDIDLLSEAVTDEAVTDEAETDEAETDGEEEPEDGQQLDIILPDAIENINDGPEAVPEAVPAGLTDERKQEFKELVRIQCESQDNPGNRPNNFNQFFDGTFTYEWNNVNHLMVTLGETNS